MCSDSKACRPTSIHPFPAEASGCSTPIYEGTVVFDERIIPVLDVDAVFPAECVEWLESMINCMETEEV